MVKGISGQIHEPFFYFYNSLAVRSCKAHLSVSHIEASELRDLHSQAVYPPVVAVLLRLPRTSKGELPQVLKSRDLTGRGRIARLLWRPKAIGAGGRGKEVTVFNSYCVAECRSESQSVR